MKKLTQYILGLSLAFLPLLSSSAQKTDSLAQKAESAIKKPDSLKSPYEKFVTKNKASKVESFCVLYRDKEDIWLEIPVSLDGRTILATSLINSSSDPRLAVNVYASENDVYRLSVTDSFVLFQSVPKDILVKDSDTSILSALGLSNVGATIYSFPIKYRSGDSTKLVFNASKLFSLDNKKVVKMKGVTFADASLLGAEFSKDGQRITGLEAFESSIGVSLETSAKLSLGGIFGEMSEKPKVTVSFQILYSLLDEVEPDDYLKVDSRIGVMSYSVPTYSSDGEIKNEKMALRWDVRGDKTIRIYFDTLLPSNWFNAVKEGILAWNKAFEEAGLGTKIEVSLFDKSIRQSPLVSTVMMGSSCAENTSLSLFSYGSHIVSCNITIPGGYVNRVRKATAPVLSDVDRRYMEYDMCDEAVCEYLRAESMYLFGRALGLLPNSAGSYAYSPKELRDPHFTRANGITASVLDGVFLNLLARQGDKEKGVVTVADRIGAYDKYAISWLYGNNKDFKFLDDMLYIPSKQGLQVDPRGINGDMGTDIVEFVDATFDHARKIVEFAPSYLDNDQVPEDYRTLFIDWIWLKCYRSLFYLSYYIGGVYVSDVRQSSQNPKYTAVEKQVQKAALKKLSVMIDSIACLDRDKTLLRLAGANKNVMDFTRQNFFSIVNSRSRMAVLAMSEAVAEGQYSVEEFLTDLQTIFLSSVKKGKLKIGEDIAIQQFISMLIGMNEGTNQRFNNAFKSSNSYFTSDEIEYRSSIKNVPTVWLEDYCWLGVKYLQSTKAILEKGSKHAKNEETRKQIEFLSYLTKVALEYNKK